MTESTLRRPRPAISARGAGTLTCGIVLGVLGVGLSTPVLVYVGVLATAAVVTCWVWLVLSLSAFMRRFPYAQRSVQPRPLSVGAPGTVTVNIRARATAHRLGFTGSTKALDIREQAAGELTGGAGTKATVDRSEESLTLQYRLQPHRRGRWPLGPALVHTSDPLGMMWADTAMGEPELVAVWPAIVDLTDTAGALMGHADRVVLGARTPSADDAALRDYRDGDDLRRVHWPSSARRGTMLVRSDERAGRRPATILVDLPRDPLGLEWAISASASIAVSVLDSGHPVRLIATGMNPAAVHHVGERGGEMGRAEVLDQTIDLVSPPSRAAGTASLVRSAALATEDSLYGEVTVAVLEPCERAAIDALVPIGDNGRAWAIVRSSDDARIAAAADDTAAALRRAGWRVTLTTEREDLSATWSRVLSEAEVGT